jgi:hypothetical protein
MKRILFSGLSLALAAAPAFAVAPAAPLSAREVVFTQLFNAANADGNEYLDEAEFANSYGASPRPAVTEFRFKAVATPVLSTRGVQFVDRGVFLGDFIEANGGRNIRPTPADLFTIADDDLDGFIDPAEFPATRVQRAATPGSIAKGFDRLDKNDDDLISRAEWGLTPPA